MVDELWPVDGARDVGDRLEAHYAFPETLQRPWVRVNFVSSLDGAVTSGGSSRALSHPVDQEVLGLIRSLSDVVLVGLGTALTEGYRGVKRHEVRAELRGRLGLSEVPPIALVTARAALPLDSPLLTDTLVPPIVITCGSAPAERRAALAHAGADVVVAGTDRVDLAAALDALDQRGLRRIGCEGGPQLFGSLVDDDLVDELCLTLSPMLASGDAGRIANGKGAEQLRAMRLESVLHSDSLLFLRYGRMPE
ncbi:pyrimidine reductase family protein [Saccharopolyspora mangrovi]|uniref:Pyrimidine reductase family protein n=1 Tax=Saccharopolyspora mangrovi TaxID=3082379 RepID=A0ABU6AAT6_9PSEU|nr:pyrimidine reductase family protein [Saccharopolyspora sp. S2-29]MEB3368553.1 pyrimidine reductase family protein [Saccharopolyspora sp. S2-29]